MNFCNLLLILPAQWKSQIACNPSNCKIYSLCTCGYSGIAGIAGIHVHKQNNFLAPEIGVLTLQVDFNDQYFSHSVV